MVQQFSPDLCRITVHADAVHVDLALPATVPVAALIPPIVDLVADRNISFPKPLVDSAGGQYRLCHLGACALDPSTTLSQNDIRDGSELVLTRSEPEPPEMRFDDVAEAVLTTLETAIPRRTRRAAQLTAAISTGWLASVGGLLLVQSAFTAPDTRHLGVAACLTAAVLGIVATAKAHRIYPDTATGLTPGLLAAGFAAATGLVAVPGGPGAPNILLAAMAAAVASVLVIRLTGCRTTILTAVACFSVIAAVTALTGLITGAPLRALGAISAVIALALLEAAARMSILSSGLSPRLSSASDADFAATPVTLNRVSTQAIRADGWLTSLVAAFSTAAAVGAVSTVAAGYAGAGQRFGSIVLATLTGLSLLLRARSEAHQTRTMVLIVNGIATLSAPLAIPAIAAPGSGSWTGAMIVTAAMLAFGLGLRTPAIACSPVLRRSAEVAEYLTLIVAAPLACWIAGLYDIVRGLTLI